MKYIKTYNKINEARQNIELTEIERRQKIYDFVKDYFENEIPKIIEILNYQHFYRVNFDTKQIYKDYLTTQLENSYVYKKALSFEKNYANVCMNTFWFRNLIYNSYLKYKDKIENLLVDRFIFIMEEDDSLSKIEKYVNYFKNKNLTETQISFDKKFRDKSKHDDFWTYIDAKDFGLL